MDNNETKTTKKVGPLGLALILGVFLLGGVAAGYLYYFDQQNKNIPMGRMAVSAFGRVNIVEPRGNSREIVDLDSKINNPAWSGDGSQLAYDKSVLGNYDIYTVNADGTGERQLTEDPDADMWPSWLPDGTGLVFVSNRDGDNELYRIAADGSQVQKLTENRVNDMEPDVSPDGTQIVFTRGDDIYVMGVDGSNQQRLTRGKGIERMPAWSPDGTQIAYVRYDDDKPYLYIMQADGSAARRVSEWQYVFSPTWSPDGTRLAFIGKDALGDFDEGRLYVVSLDNPDSVARLSESFGMRVPTWSPDGSRIALVEYDELTLVEAALPVPQSILSIETGYVRDSMLSSDGTQIVFIRDGDVYTMSVDGQDVNQLTATEALESDPAWSPDAAQIVFVSNADGDNELYSMNADGSGRRQLTVNTVDDNHPAWSPDGTRLVYRSGPENAGELFLMTLDTGTVEPLTNDEVADDYPVWSPDGSQLAYTHDGSLWVMNADGEGASLLTEKNRADEYVLAPAWSPDGTRLAFVYAPTGAVWGGSVLQMYVVALDGEAEQMVAAEGLFSSPSWFPNGDELLYANQMAILRRPARPPEEYYLESLVERPVRAGHISWSPDSIQLVLTDGYDVVLMYANGAGAHLLTDDGTSGMPEWSPDGRQIVFVSSRSGKQAIYVMDADGANQRQLTDSEASDSSPTWSANGRQIAFISFEGDQSDVFVMDANGENIRQLTDDGVYKWALEWSPNGRWLAFLAASNDGESGSRVQVMNADGSNRRTLVSGVEFLGDDLTWSPDSKWLAYGEQALSGGVFNVIRANGNGETKYQVKGFYAAWTR